jgi:hypothetical protein
LAGGAIAREAGMAKVGFITYLDKQILLLDFSGTPEEILPAIKEARMMVATQPHNSVLTLTDVSDSQFNNDVRESLKALTLHNKPYVKAAAVVGVTGLKKVLLSVVMKFSGRNLVTFNSLDEAKNWLVVQ